MKIPCPLHKAASRTSETLAIIAPGRRLYYGEWDRLVAATSERLRTLGCTRVACYLPNSWRLLTLLVGTIRAGGVVCPISTRVPPQRLQTLLDQVGSRVLVTERENVGEYLRSEVTVVTPGEVVPDEPGIESEYPESLDLDQPTTIVFTSGSSGRPKAGLHAFGNHYFSAKGSNENIALAPGDRWLLALPLVHVGGLGILFRCLLAGATIVIPERKQPMADTCARHRVTHVSMVATQLRRFLHSEDGRASTLRAVLVGGSPIPPGLIETAYARGCPLHTTYGCTEMASQVTTTPAGASLEALYTSGRVLPYRRLRIADDGEILVKGKTLFQGYVDGATVRLPVDDEGWFHTGDRGWLDDDGYLHVRGRVDRMFISGGENIQPEEIEQALCQLDDVERAVVVPVADEEFGHRPVAFVRVARGDVGLDDLAGRLKPMLAAFKIPDTFYAWPEREQGMKVDRTYFRQRAEMLTHRTVSHPDNAS